MLDKFDRFQLLHRLFRASRYPIPVSRLAERLECTEKTVKRAIESMRDYLDAPIEYYPASKGWQYSKDDNDLYELPGLWLTSHELQSLALLLQVIGNMGRGLLSEEMGVIEAHITRRLKARGIPRSVFDECIKVLPLHSRTIPGQVFSQVVGALVAGQRIEIRYKGFDNATTGRTLSPQTLVYYRENWYLDAWCHLRQALRTFSLARIEILTPLNAKALRIDKQLLADHFASSYGIFAGEAEQQARLRFYPEIAREIASQYWHPEQIGEWDGDDYLLTLPYSDDRELIKDILRYMPDIYVEAPISLRNRVRQRLEAGLKVFH